MHQAELIIIGGANGSGKTTFARELIDKTGIKYLGADEIASQINKKNPENAAIEAARLFSGMLSETIEYGKSLVVESTLSGVSLKKFLNKAKGKNFKIGIYFIYLDSPELCIKRIASRVARGGHYISPEDVRRRFGRSNYNFWHNYRQLADNWNLFYNAGINFQQIAAYIDKNVIMFDELRYEKWLKMVTR